MTIDQLLFHLVAHGLKEPRVEMSLSHANEFRCSVTWLGGWLTVARNEGEVFENYLERVYRLVVKP